MPQLVQPMAFLRLGCELNQVDPIKLLQAVGKIQLSVFRKLRKFLIYMGQPCSQSTQFTIYNLPGTTLAHYSLQLAILSVVKATEPHAGVHLDFFWPETGDISFIELYLDI